MPALVWWLMIHSYSPPGQLASILKLKQREVQKLYQTPQAQTANGEWALRLGYAANTASYKLQRAIGFKSSDIAIVGDYKRSAQGQKLGQVELVAKNLKLARAVEESYQLGLSAIMVNIDQSIYGG